MKRRMQPFSDILRVSAPRNRGARPGTRSGTGASLWKEEEEEKERTGLKLTYAAEYTTIYIILHTQFHLACDSKQLSGSPSKDKLVEASSRLAQQNQDLMQQDGIFIVVQKWQLLQTLDGLVRRPRMKQGLYIASISNSTHAFSIFLPSNGVLSLPFSRLICQRLQYVLQFFALLF